MGPGKSIRLWELHGSLLALMVAQIGVLHAQMVYHQVLPAVPARSWPGKLDSAIHAPAWAFNPVCVVRNLSTCKLVTSVVLARLAMGIFESSGLSLVWALQAGLIEPQIATPASQVSQHGSLQLASYESACGLLQKSIWGAHVLCY